MEIEQIRIEEKVDGIFNSNAIWTTCTNLERRIFAK